MIGSDYVLEAHNIYHTTEVRLSLRACSVQKCGICVEICLNGRLMCFIDVLSVMIIATIANIAMVLLKTIFN